MTTVIVMVVATEEIGDNHRLIVEVGDINQTHHLNGYMAEVVRIISKLRQFSTLQMHHLIQN